MSYVDLMETILVKKEDVKPSAGAAARLKKAIAANPVVPDESMDTTPVPVPDDSPSSKTMILRPLCNNSPRLSTYETEPMCSD